MKWPATVIAVVIGIVNAACGGSPTAPSDAGTPRILQGQTVSAADGTSAPNISVKIGHLRPVMSDAEGMFQIDLEDPPSYAAVLSGHAMVERQTTLTGPFTDRVRLSLIPSAFDLTAFDEMFRTSNSRLQRWTTRPRLVVLATVMNYRSSPDETYVATSEQLTDEEVAAMVAHLTEGLALLTGGSYTTFSSVDVERPAEGARVSAMRAGAIVVGRYNGVLALAATIGYGQWAEQRDGAVTGGAMFLDSDFDKSDARRRLLRIHELGHALGYRHVTSRTSIMNPSIGPEPTDFDRVGAIIAFQRPPGNKAPDTDPGSGSRSPFGLVTAGGSVWATPVLCGIRSQS
jgi:hypothetical protein